MIAVIDSFSAGYRPHFEHDPSSVVFEAFSAGVADKRHPAGSTVICDYFACGTTRGLDLPDVLFVRQK